MIVGYSNKETINRLRNHVSKLETELAHYKDAFEVVEAEMLKRVPFEAFKRLCCPANSTQYCYKRIKRIGCFIHVSCTPDNCKLIPKVKTDE
jgi:hypothetical protein